jgi:carbon-monoxide dehydrogenase small subunit
MQVQLTVNGTPRSDDVEPRQLLVHYLREVCGLRAANIGCDTTSCGACTVLLNGESVKSCTLLTVQAADQDIVTAEGLSADGELHPVQQAFRTEHGLQCGFCTPGMVMAAISLSAKALRATCAGAPATTTSSALYSPPRASPPLSLGPGSPGPRRPVRTRSR